VKEKTMNAESVPAKPTSVTELSEEDLERVAGGASPITPTIVVVTMGGGAVISGVGTAIVSSVTITEEGW
jgi:lactobin A/cerein 7B family class IIb bacteriocin